MKNLVYRLIPKDFDQESSDALVTWYRRIYLFLNQLEAKKGSIEYFYKIYSIAEEIYLETNFQDDLYIPDVELLKLEDPQHLIVELGNSYGETVLKSDYLKVNGIYFRLINLYEFSKTLVPSALMDIGDFCLFFKKIESHEAKRIVGMQRKIHHSHLYTMMRNIESENSFKEAEKVTEEIIQGESNLFKVEGWIIVKAETEIELNFKTKEVIKNLKQIEIDPLIETEGLKTLFIPILYNGVPTFKRSHEPTTKYLANLLPLKNDFLHRDGIELKSYRGNSLFFKLFDDESLNFNVLISGQSGTGKSMIAQKILLEEVNKGASAIVLDLGNSFKKTVKFLKGESLSLSFNPFQFKDPHFLKEFIISVIPEAELNQKTEGKIFSLIQENLETVTSLKELIEIISTQIPDLEYYFSELWDYFDNETRVLNRLTYVDTSIYPDRIKAPLIIYLIECFKHLEGKRIFIFDEVWSFLSKNAEYISECFRTFRKHGASAIPISQGIEDFTQTPLGLSIAQNCFTKLYFNQSTNTSNFLDEFDLSKIRDLSTKKGDYSSFYVKSETKRKVAFYIPSLIEYELFTSNFEDNQSFETFLKKNEEYFPFPEITKRYVNFKYHSLE